MTPTLSELYHGRTVQRLLVCSSLEIRINRMCSARRAILTAYMINVNLHMRVVPDIECHKTALYRVCLAG